MIKMKQVLFVICGILVHYLSWTIGHTIEDVGLKIAGGSDSPPGSAPYNVMILFRDNYICCGSILSKRTILTAEQCVDKNNPLSFSIVVNTTKMSQPGRLYRVQHILSHPGNDKSSRRHDLALIFLEKDIVFSKDVQVISIGEGAVDEGLDTLTRGWGLTNVTNETMPDNLQMINLKTLNLERCREMWEDMADIQEDEICAFSQSGGGMCYGDSGGALVHKGKAIGVSSWGYSCAFGHPDVFTSLSHHAQWIKDNII